jgi:hypothetical protein
VRYDPAMPARRDLGPMIVAAAAVSLACGRFGFGPGQDGRTDALGADAAEHDADGGLDLTSGLFAAFSFEEGSGSTFADSSGRGHHGRLYRTDTITREQGKLGGGVRFDGTAYASYALFPASGEVCANVPRLRGSLTASAWARFEQFGDWGGYTLGTVVMMQGTTGGLEGGWGLGATNGCGPQTAGFAIAVADSLRATRCGQTVLALDAWVHLMGVYDAEARTLDVYVNGELDSGALTPGSQAISEMISSPNHCAFLAAPANQSRLLIGSIDEVRLYERALSATEVRALYEQSGGGTN